MGALLALPALWLGNPAMAAPSAYNSKCGAITIDNFTDATLLRDTEDCKLIWVLPPSSGTTQLTGYTPSGALGFCGEVKDGQKASRELMNSIAKTNEGLKDLEPEYKKAKERMLKAKADHAALLKTDELKQLDAMETDLADVKDRIDEVLNKISNCSTNCDELESEYRSLKDSRKRLTDDIRTLRKQNLATAKKFDKSKAMVDSATEAYNLVGDEIAQVARRQGEFRELLHGMLLALSRYEGGYAHLDYNTRWDDAVDQLTAKYGDQYQFSKIPTKDARIFANIVGANDKELYLSSMPAILDYSINGLEFLPWGEERTVEMSSLPSHLTGSIRMSLMGGCPLRYKNFLEQDGLIPNESTPDNYNFAISATYSYPASYKMSMTASYNLYKMYEKIVQSSSRGGFFSSRSHTSVVENKVDRDTFNIDWTVEDPDSKYSETERQKIASELKQELIGRVLGAMAQPIFQGVPPKDASVAPPGEHGAIVLAKGLENTCGAASVWCTGGAWLLRGLDAVFGSNKASSYYKATHDRTATETWSANTTRWNSAGMVFTNQLQ